MPRKGRPPALTKEQCLAKYGVERLPSDPAQRIAITKPWKKSTGPRTDAGKRVTSRNRLKHGLSCRNWVISYAARLRWEGLMLEEFKTEIAPLLDVLEQRLPGLEAVFDQLLKDELNITLEDVGYLQSCLDEF